MASTRELQTLADEKTQMKQDKISRKKEEGQLRTGKQKWNAFVHLEAFKRRFLATLMLQNCFFELVGVGRGRKASVQPHF